MKSRIRFPIRLKMMISLLFGITAVVSVISFTMANFFHDDKSSYLNDWVSIGAVTTAEECSKTLHDYQSQLEIASVVMIDESMGPDERAAFLQRMFNNAPDLIEIAVFQGGEMLEIATDTASLEDVQLPADAVQAYRTANPLPMDSIASGEVFVRNTTLSEELPSFTLAFPVTIEGEEPFVIASMLRMDGLLRLGSNFRVFEIVVADDQGTLLAHPDVSRVARQQSAGLRTNAAELEAQFRAGTTLEYVHEGREMIGGFAPAAFGVTVAAHMPKGAAYLASRELLVQLFFVALALLVGVAIIGWMWARRITRPVERLSAATRVIAQGQFDVEIDVASRDEIGELAGSFNKMTTDLRDRDEALETAQNQLVQSEKMAAFGQLGAGIAHEVKNPLAGILGCAQLALMEVDEDSGMYHNLSLIEKETSRCTEIINKLMSFSRQEKPIFEPTPINSVVQDAVSIINHQLDLNQVKVIQDLEASLPDIQANSNQLQQVLMNLMINAQQAMDGEPGQVKVTTSHDDDRVEIVVRDNGPGIPEDIQKKLFEPFFTTKPTGKGTGLGLSVSFGIIRDHNGEITVESEVGEGTAFIIRLPRKFHVEDTETVLIDDDGSDALSQLDLTSAGSPG